MAALLDKVDNVQSDYDRLSSEKKFLEDYIGNLMVRPKKFRRKTEHHKHMQQASMRSMK